MDKRFSNEQLFLTFLQNPWFAWRQKRLLMHLICLINYSIGTLLDCSEQQFSADSPVQGQHHAFLFEKARLVNSRT
jgi:hypothetical protein